MQQLPVRPRFGPCENADGRAAGPEMRGMNDMLAMLRRQWTGLREAFFFFFLLKKT
jgi:hypothetical protein